MSKRKTTKPVAKKSTKRKRRRPVYRLACVSCDREDYDGINCIPKTRREVQRYQALTEWVNVPNVNRRKVKLDQTSIFRKIEVHVARTPLSLTLFQCDGLWLSQKFRGRLPVISHFEIFESSNFVGPSSL